MGDASLQKVSAIREKLIGGGTILAWRSSLNIWPVLQSRKVGAEVMDLWRLTDSSANWNLAARIG
jgi:hypothetical protein